MRKTMKVINKQLNLKANDLAEEKVVFLKGRYF